MDEALRIPKRIGAEIDRRKLPLTDEDDAVLAKIDGAADERVLASALGMEAEAVHDSVTKLALLGLVTFAQPPADDVDLEPAHRQRIEELHARLRQIDYYSLLGVGRDADKKTIKRAYYELAASYHPDRFFRKKLGAYKPKMEAIFGRATQAHDVLTDKAQRAEYDQYLQDVDKSRGIEAMLKDALAEMERAEQAVKEAVPEAPLDLAPVPTPAAAPSPQPAAPRPSSPTLAASPQDLAARRAVLARRLLGSRAPAAPSPAARAAAGPSASAPHESTAAAMDALRRRYEERVSSARRFQAKRYADNGKAALGNNDPVAAANAYRVALSLTPDDEQLKKTYDEVQRTADGILSETYERQAGYEEKSERWEDAARSWARVAQARPDAGRPQERACNALVKANGDLHQAVAFGRRAVQLEPSNPASRVTLAHAYVAAGLLLNAKRELDVAAQISPHDGTIQSLLKKLGKGP